MKNLTILSLATVLIAGGQFPLSVVTAQSRAVQNTARLDRLKSETRSGEAVTIRGRQLLARNAAFKKAYADLEARGRHPAFGRGVILLAADLAKNIKYSSQSIVDADYEIGFFPFDNADPKIWEGIVYARGPSREVILAGAIDGSSQDPKQWKVLYQTTYQSGGVTAARPDRYSAVRAAFVKEAGATPVRGSALPVASPPDALDTLLECLGTQCAFPLGFCIANCTGCPIDLIIECTFRLCFANATRCFIIGLLLE